MNNKLRNGMWVAVTGLVLAACGGGTADTIMVPTTTPATLPTVTVAPAPMIPTPEEEYLDLLAQNTSLRMLVSDAELIELGWMVCDFYSQGGTTDEITNIIIDSAIQSGLTRSQIMELAKMAGLAVATLCPENSWRV